MLNPVNYTIELSANIILLNFEGEFNLPDLDTFSPEILSDKQFVTHLNRIYDYSQCNKIALTTTQIMTFVVSSRHLSIDRDIKIAFIAKDQEDAGLLRILAASVTSLVIKVFFSQSEARQWQEISRTPDNLTNVEHHLIRFQGKIGLEEIMAAQLDLVEAGSDEIPLLWDLRQATISESIDSVCDMAVYIAANHERDRDGVKSAVLVGSHINELLYRKMTTVDNWPDSESKLFRSYREAIAWLAA